MIKRHLDGMLRENETLFERILDTPGFGKHFNELCSGARQIEKERRELIRALVWMERATCQGHRAHWDKTGQGGAGCPACNQAYEQRERASRIIKQATGESLWKLAVAHSVTEE